MIDGAIGGLANGGGLAGMVQGMAFGAFGGIGNIYGRFMAQGMLGGMQSVMAGGKFGHGFFSAGIGGLGGGNGYSVQSFFQSAVLGGVASEITGGKFKNGAASAAFMYAVSMGISKFGPGGSGTEEVEGLTYQNSGEADIPDELLRDNIRLGANGNPILDLSVSISGADGTANAREKFIEKVNGSHVGKRTGFWKWKKGTETALTVNLTEYHGVGEGDIHIVSREEMINRNQASIAAFKKNPQMCMSACTAKERNWMAIHNTSIPSYAMLHEVFHAYGIRHRTSGLMHKNGGNLRWNDVQNLRELYFP